MAKIMIVDDNADILETLKIVIQHENYALETAKNGEEFLSKIDSAKPDLILLDVMMPGLTTRQILDKLNERGLTSLKIILVTVVRFTEEELRDLKRDSGIVDYVTKPFDVSELVSTIKRHLV